MHWKVFGVSGRHEEENAIKQNFMFIGFDVSFGNAAIPGHIMVQVAVDPK